MKYVRNDVIPNSFAEEHAVDQAIGFVDKFGLEEARRVVGESIDDILAKYAMVMNYHYELKFTTDEYDNPILISYVESCINLTNEFGESNARRICGDKYDYYMERFAMKVYDN